MKDIKGYQHIPKVLFVIITFLVGALPIRSVPTFIELLFGAMLSQAGFVTQAWLAINMHRHWTSYYKWLQKGTWSWVSLGLQMARMLLSLFPNQQRLIIIDDTIILRVSKKAPDSKIHHKHGNKANRPRYVQGQCWVSLAGVATKGLTAAAIPLLSRMMRTGGNTSKLDAARVLIRTILPVFAGQNTCLLLDAWYMRYRVIAFALKNKIQVIGQVRLDCTVPLSRGTSDVRNAVDGIDVSEDDGFHLRGLAHTEFFQILERRLSEAPFHGGMNRRTLLFDDALNPIV